MPRKPLRFPCLEIVQPIGAFYVGVIPALEVIDIAFSDIIRIDEDDRNIEVVSGLERPISRDRVKELREYVTHFDATFPTGVILSIPEKYVKYDAKSREMTIESEADYSDIAKIIDGQHRIEGLRGYTGDVPFQLNVTIFVEMDPEKQAIVFSIINLKQAPVSKSITYELFEYAKSRSPQKTCHEIATALDRAPGSPFEGKIMVLGSARDADKETLTQAAFIRPLLKLISSEKLAMGDRDMIRRGKRISMPTGTEVIKRAWVFRPWFLLGEDKLITQSIVNYFNAVARKWEGAWWPKTPGLMLNRTNGYSALIRFLPSILFKLGPFQVHSVSSFASVLNSIHLKYDDFNSKDFLPGSTGEGDLLRRLLSESGLEGIEPDADTIKVPQY